MVQGGSESCRTDFVIYIPFHVAGEHLNKIMDYGQVLWKTMVFLIFSTLVSAQYPIENFTATVNKSRQTGKHCFTQPCIFPFTYKGSTFNDCTLFDGDEEWCASKVYDNGTMKDWDYCSATNMPCQFPFYYDGITFTECTRYRGIWDRDGNGPVVDVPDVPVEWCATGVYANRTMKEGEWAWCGKDCPKGQGIPYDRIMCFIFLYCTFLI